MSLDKQILELLNKNYTHKQIIKELKTTNYKIKKTKRNRHLIELLQEPDIFEEQYPKPTEKLKKSFQIYKEKIKYSQGVTPIINPVRIQISLPKIERQEKKDFQKAIIIPDIQTGFKRENGKLIPFHDRQCIDIALQITRDVEPDRIVFLGDDADLPEWSTKYLASPDCYFTTQLTLYELAWIYGQFRMAAPYSEIDAIDGNHTLRFRTSIIAKLPQAYNLKSVKDNHPLFSMENLLGLDDLRIKYHGPYPTGEVWLNENFRLVHGEVVRTGSGKTVSSVVNDIRTNEGFGHLHRSEMASKTVWSFDGPKVYQAWSFGTLCSIKPGVVPATINKNNWQNSIGYIEYEKGNGFATVTPIMIYSDKAFFNGKRYIARTEDEILNHLKHDLGQDLYN